jgi:hypothetical protein
MKNLCGILIICIISMLDLAYAEEPIKLQETTVIGNRELPKITHIVPWQAAQPPDPEQPPIDHLIDDALMPLDRDAFRRSIHNYYELSPVVQAPDESSRGITKQ